MRLIYKIGLCFLLIIILFSIADILSISYVLEHMQEVRLKTAELLFARSLSKRFFRDVVEEKPFKLTDTLFEEKKLREEKIEYILIFDKKGYLLAHTYLGTMPKQLLKLKNDFDSEEKYRIEKIKNEVIFVYDIAVPVLEGIKQVGTVHVGIKGDYIQNIIKTTSGLLVIITSVVMGMGIFIAFFMSRKITKPIIDLNKIALEIGKGNLDLEVKTKSKDEIAELGASFNKMAKNLKLSRDELLLAKDYTDNILKSMIDTLIVVDADAKIKTVNKATLDLLGYAEEELVGKPVAIIFAEEEEEEEEEIINEISEESLLISKDFKILKVNNAFMRETGLERENIIGQYCYKITHHRDSICQPPDDRCPISEVEETGKPCVEIHRHFDKDGNKLLVAVVATPITDRSGNIICYLHFARKLKEGEMQRIDMGRTEELIDKIKGYAVKLGGRVRERSIFSKAGLKELIRKDSVRDYDMTYKTKSGERIPVSFSGSVMRDKEGELVGIVGIARDMREINRLMQKEKELAAAAAAAAETDRKRAAELDKAYNELKEKTEDLEKFHEVTVGRELDMVKLKEEINSLLKTLGQPKKYEEPDKIKEFEKKMERK